MQLQRAIQLSKFILIIIVVIAIGIFIVNQTINIMYKSKLIQQPCELCRELNPQFDQCFRISKFARPINIDLNLSSIKN